MKCPKCDLPQMKKWDELSADEQFIAQRLPMSATFSAKERKQHLFCPRCQHEASEEKVVVC